MLTRCPHCETDFRVTPEQLKVRQGQVRCGTCRGVFNAIDSLADELLVPMKFPAHLAPTPPAAAEPESLPDVLPAWMPAAFPRDTPQADATPPAEPASDATDAIDAAAAQPDMQPDAPPEPAPDNDTGAAAASWSTTATNAVDAEVSPPSQDEPVSEDDESRRWQDEMPRMGCGAPESGQGAAAESAPLTNPPVPAKTTTTLAPAAWGPFVETPRPQRWPWVAGLVVLLLLAAGQLLYLFRVELAVVAPELRPALVAGCEHLGCTLPRPRKAELIGIESSDLAPAGAADAAGAGRLSLTATLKNRAPFDQEYPHLELTLTDTQDYALLRKVLAPAEYLPANRAAGAGFAANGDVAVRLTLEISGIPAVGYRLYLFYP
ncbi:MAG: DUF3426 domain-containing protein [Gammaproteobacteria bacterium]|nr:DUF3426 domain-containing protein [Rhodocyclaceae bacterium]MBU3908180.1 DUF3426 domain-containing protein [Gammaproteobacteria bacterium]MBU3989118.1 DUF3426 domain-containing protein [Gammaproteobacteria bacterium]MBU4005995.1 DUF3426 domain-containing protein [Gammaproteobacteria bacterium]MBU4019999.1 DUF3426 domain-containing protein [Gammaproteobacteria bacterium]